MVSSVNDNILCVPRTHSFDQSVHTAHLLSNRNREFCVYITKKQREVIDLPLFVILRGFRLKPSNRYQKVPDRSERDETCTCGTCTCTSSSLRCSASSWMLSAFPRNFVSYVDVGIVAPYHAFVKRFLTFYRFLQNIFPPRRPFCVLFGGVFFNSALKLCGYAYCADPTESRRQNHYKRTGNPVHYEGAAASRFRRQVQYRVHAISV